MVQTVPGAYTSAKVHAEGTYFEPCKLRTHSAGCPSPLTPHHCVPDHCWKATGRKTSRISLAGAKPPTMGHGSGLCICVDGSGKYSDSSAGDKYRQLSDAHKDKLANLQSAGDSKSLAATFKSQGKGHTSGTTAIVNNMGKHGQIHHTFDAAENSLAAKNRTNGLGKNVATLDQLEDLAAETISKVTGCDKNDLKKQMRDYHHSCGIRKGTLLRANASGRGKAHPGPNLTLGSPP